MQAATFATIVVAPLAEQTERLVVEADPVAWRVDLEDYLASVPAQLNDCDKYSWLPYWWLVVQAASQAAVLLLRRLLARSAGYVTLAVPDAIVSYVQMMLPRFPLLASCDAEGVPREAVLCNLPPCVRYAGWPWRTSLAERQGYLALLDSELARCVDADALNCIARLTNNNLEFPRLAPSVPLAHHDAASSRAGVPG